MDNHYLIIKTDHVNHREARVIDQMYKNKRNAEQQMENHIFSYIYAKDGRDAAEAALNHPFNEKCTVYTSSQYKRQTDRVKSKDVEQCESGVKLGSVVSRSSPKPVMERIVQRPNGYIETTIASGHFVTRDAEQNINKYTVWKKAQCDGHGYIYSYKQPQYTRIFSIEIAEIIPYFNEFEEVSVEEDDSTWSNRRAFAESIQDTDTMQHLFNRFEEVKALNRDDFLEMGVQLLDNITYPPLKVSEMKQEFADEYNSLYFPDNTVFE